MIKVISGKNLGPWGLVAPPPNVCQECAVDHPPEYPHNQQSLFYQYKFFNDHGRWPTWEDAMAHCSEEIKAFWRAELRKRGIEI